jgi:hypothetical protein
MNKRSYEATLDDGADIEFDQQYSIENAEEEYKRYIKENPKEKKQYPSADDLMTSYYCLVLEDGFYGSYTNNDGLYDWYEVGGRWANLLPEFSNKKELKKIVDKALDLKQKQVKEIFRDKVDVYVQLKSLPLDLSATALKIGGCNSILISEKLSAKTILDWWVASYNSDASKNTYTRKNIINDVTDYFLLEHNEEGRDELIYGVDMQTFIDTYNYYVKVNKKTQRDYRYNLTMLDLHT